MKTDRMKSERPRRKYDFYPTPYGLAKESLVTLINESHAMDIGDRVLDAGATVILGEGF